jgi:preprotein translocase subunit SecA
MKKFIENIFSPDKLKGIKKEVEKINNKENELKDISLEEIRNKSEELKSKAKNGVDLDDLLPLAFALVRETAKRTLKQRHYDVQLMGGIALHKGEIAEMLTGEGKTLASTAPIYLNSLPGKGVHVVTVNDYLAKRDTVWMGQVYKALGVSVSCLVHDGAYIYDPEYKAKEEFEKLDKERDEKGSFKVVEDFLRPVPRKEAYQADITYGTNHEFGFDYLRDNLVLRLEDKIQRKHNYAIIDEVDSILIDEARTPLIISTPDEESSGHYKKFTSIVKNLNEEEDYEIDEKKKIVNLTDSGFSKVERLAGVDNIFSPENSSLVHYLNECLKAKTLFRKDKEYVVKKGEVIIVDQFTGRLMPGRRYSGGLHQAIEAKEGVAIKSENKTFAQITIQNYFRFYDKLAGMTGTAATSAEEFYKVYKLEVIQIPPNKPVVREDYNDIIYKTKEAKYKAIAKEVKRLNEKGQPVLLGTTSIDNNEVIADYISKEGIKCEVLNAKNNEREGAIIAQAGKKGAVTVATNMAGRGVDIVLGGYPLDKEKAEEVKSLGGLYVIGTERHEARRIDNQLRGRAGRQGDPGSSRFFLSLEDDVLRIFGGERISNMMQNFNAPEDMPIEFNMISKAVNQAQKRVEGMNFDIRKYLLEFDDVLNRQRDAIYARRIKFLKAGENNEILPIVREIIETHVNESVANLQNEINELIRVRNDEEIKKREEAIKEMKEKLNEIPEEIEPKRSNIISRHITRILDSLWVNHLEALQSLKESVNIRAYAQHEPIVEYRREAYKMYQQLKKNFNFYVFKSVFQIFEVNLDNVQDQLEEKKESSPVSHSGGNVEKGRTPEGKKIGRNDPCWCGSGKKYKHCHGK